MEGLRSKGYPEKMPEVLLYETMKNFIAGVNNHDLHGILATKHTKERYLDNPHKTDEVKCTVEIFVAIREHKHEMSQGPCPATQITQH